MHYSLNESILNWYDFKVELWKTCFESNWVQSFISVLKHQIYHQLIFSLKSYAKEKLITVRIIDENKNQMHLKYK
jgi:hypothetical protein